MHSSLHTCKAKQHIVRKTTKKKKFELDVEVDDDVDDKSDVDDSGNGDG